MLQLIRPFIDSVFHRCRRVDVINRILCKFQGVTDLQPRIFLALGVAIIIWVATGMWSEFWTYTAAALRTSDASAATKQAYDCKYADCGTCLTEVDAFRDGVVFTAGSGAVYGFDIDSIRKSSSRPIVNCIIYGTTLDGFPLIVNQRNRLSSTQSLLHAVNSWVMIDGGHFSKYDTRPNPYFFPPGHVASPVSTKKLTLFFILLKRHFSEYQVQMRLGLREWPRSLSTLPLSQDAHLRLKERLMQRHIKISPWAASFLQNVDSIPSLEQLRERVRRVRDHFRPVDRIVLFTMPEYTPITQAQRKHVYTESKDRFLAVLREFGIEHIDVDYRRCGLGRDDYWKESVFLFDPVHPKESAREKITKCMLEELGKHDVF
jgi:hypothetical protein